MVVVLAARTVVEMVVPAVVLIMLVVFEILLVHATRVHSVDVEMDPSSNSKGSHAKYCAWVGVRFAFKLSASSSRDPLVLTASSACDGLDYSPAVYLGEEGRQWASG